MLTWLKNTFANVGRYKEHPEKEVSRTTPKTFTNLSVEVKALGWY